MNQEFPIRPTKAEISLDNVKFNFDNIKAKAKNKKICAVVKADAYGHGLEVIKKLYDEGSDYFAVAFLDEGVHLRKNGFTDIPILILGPSDESQIDQIIDYDITPTVFSLDLAEKLSKEAKKKDKIVPIHLKIDTGMGRIGFSWNEAIDEIEKISKLDNIKIDGIFTHFATADEKDKTFTQEQLRRFRDLIKKLEEKGINIPIKHIENSAALMDCDIQDFNMVRPGIILYGLYPSSEVNFDNLALKPVMRFLSKVEHIKWLDPGDSVGYGRTYIAESSRKVATIPVGYADGYSRILSHKNTEVLINGKRAPVLGNICMDQAIIDITDIEDVKIGDDVELFGEKISADEIAQKLGTINYEVTCMVNKRVPRVYIEDSNIKMVRNELLD